MVKISASILSGKDNIVNTLNEYNNLNIDYIHLDVMDGKFVSNIAFSKDEIVKVIGNTIKKLDVHLMVEEPLDYIDLFSNANTSYITIHYEVLKDINILNRIKEKGIKCGISIKPNTKIEDIYYLLPFIDLVLIMSVEPGEGGQEFIYNSLDKIELLHNEIINKGLNSIISVDGGINNNTIEECKNKGVDMVVVGSALYNSNNRNEYLKILN